MGNVKMYSLKGSFNTELNMVETSLYSKKIFRNSFFQNKSIGVSLKKDLFTNYCLKYGYGKYIKSFSNSKLLCSLNTIAYLQKNDLANYFIGLNFSFMKRLSSGLSLNSGLDIPLVEFQKSRFSDILISFSINKFFNSKYKSREGSKYLKSIKKKVLWFWVNDN